jgi:hypothetical protein
MMNYEDSQFVIIANGLFTGHFAKIYVANEETKDCAVHLVNEYGEFLKKDEINYLLSNRNSKYVTVTDEDNNGLNMYKISNYRVNKRSNPYKMKSQNDFDSSDSDVEDGPVMKKQATSNGNSFLPVSSPCSTVFSGCENEIDLIRDIMNCPNKTQRMRFIGLRKKIDPSISTSEMTSNTTEDQETFSKQG